MLLLALTFASSVAAPDPNRPPVVVAVPFGGDVSAEAMASAVENALPQAARERGLGTVRADSVKPVAEALRACKDDGCRVKNARRLGARYAVVGTVDHGALLLRILDVEVGDSAGSARVDGDPPALLAQIPVAVDGVVDQVAPKATHVRTAAIARARRARSQGDLDAADAAFAEAIAASKSDGDVVNLWLERARLFDAADRTRESAVWDAFAAALGPGTPGHAALGDVDKARVRTALHEDLRARAAYDEGFADKPAHLAAAARIHLRIAALFPDESAAETLAAGRLLADAGEALEAKPLLQKLAGDDAIDADVRLQALAALHASE